MTTVWLEMAPMVGAAAFATNPPPRQRTRSANQRTRASRDSRSRAPLTDVNEERTDGGLRIFPVLIGAYVITTSCADLNLTTNPSSLP